MNIFCSLKMSYSFINYGNCPLLKVCMNKHSYFEKSKKFSTFLLFLLVSEFKDLETEY